MLHRTIPLSDRIFFNKNTQVYSLLTQSWANEKKLHSCWRCYIKGKKREKLGLYHLCFGDVFVIQLDFLICAQEYFVKNIVWYYWALKTLLFVMSYKTTELIWHTENVYLFNKHFTCIHYTVAKTSTVNSSLKDLLVKVYDFYFNEKREKKILENYVSVTFMLQFFKQTFLC